MPGTRLHIHPIKMRMPLEDNPSAYAPLMAAAVETPDQLLMVDTGFPGETDLLDALDILHLYPEDFTAVLNTHAHIDHIGNNQAFPNARILVSRVDFHYLGKFYYDMIHVHSPVDVLQHYFPHSNSKRIDTVAQHSLHLAETYWDEALLGDMDKIEWIEDSPSTPPFVELVRTPGHTPGHYAVIMHGRDKDIMFCGDSMPSRLFWRRSLYELAPRYDTSLFDHSKHKVENFKGIIMGGHDLPFDSESGKYYSQPSIKI